MIKVFTSGEIPLKAGDVFTNMISEWEKSLGSSIEMKSIHTNSNKFGWMIVIHYDFMFSESD